ncbi:hypothetical protein V6N11_022099 [Hibiscus sabdariffa]|uniref:Retrotransposon gag domain-containing protein n=1 Tax=Hibiscus sabdariffa TaxID=183260 RepID=A0ABR2TJ55_9ROSI
MDGKIEGLEKTMEDVQGDIVQMKDFLDPPMGNEVMAENNDGQASASRVEAVLQRYFHFNGIGDEDKLEVAAVCLDGKALNWFQWCEARTPIVTWDVFRVAILHRFTPSQQGNLYEVLLGLQQTRSIAQYREDFELLSATLKDAVDEVLIGIFINGLREEIKAELHLSKLGSLAQIMDQSQRIEEKNWALNQAQLPRNQRVAPPRISPFFSTVESSRSTNTTGSSVRPAPAPFVPLHSTPMTAPWHFYEHKREDDAAMGIESSSKRGGPYKRLSYVEYHEKLKKGFCFRFDEKYSPNHRCNSKQLNLLIVTAQNEDEDIDGLPGEAPRSDTDHLHDPGQQDTEKLLELSLQSIIGFTSKKSLKVWSTILGKKVIVLIDSGASTNFISRSVAEALKLKQTTTTPFVVEVGTGQRVKCMGSCKQVELWIDGLQIIQDYFLFNLGSADVVLGLEWLETLGDIQANFRTLKLKLGRQSLFKYRPGCENKAAAALSRQFQFMAFSVLRTSTLDDISLEIQQDDNLRQITQDLLLAPASRPYYSLKKGCLFFKNRTLVDGSSEVLIKRKDLPDFENTWESYEVISAQFPNFPLEDKVKFVGAGIVRPAIPKVCS